MVLDRSADLAPAEEREEGPQAGSMFEQDRDASLVLAVPGDWLQARYFGHQQITVIEPSRSWNALDLRDLWAYRELLVVLSMRDVKVRCRQTVLGVMWAILQPFMQIESLTDIDCFTCIWLQSCAKLKRGFN
jgi:hypothetical protein